MRRSRHRSCLAYRSRNGGNHFKYAAGWELLGNYVSFKAMVGPMLGQRAGKLVDASLYANVSGIELEYVNSDIYGQPIPRELVDHGIESIDRRQGECILTLYDMMQQADRLERLATHNFSLKQSLAGTHKIMGRVLDMMDFRQLAIMPRNDPLVEVVRQAARMYDDSVGRPYQFDIMLDMNLAIGVPIEVSATG